MMQSNVVVPCDDILYKIDYRKMKMKVQIVYKTL